MVGILVGKRSAVIAALALLLGLVASMPASASSGPKPLAPAQATGLVAAPSVLTGGSEAHPVSLAEALAAGERPGAIVGRVGVVSPTAGEVTGCASSNSWWQWGTWPYQQRIDETTYWCAVYGVRVTYRSTNVTASGTLCGADSTSNQIISGGIGYSWFVVRATATWSCATAIPWITLHPTHHLDTSRNAWGSSEIVGAG